jgi:hypothetical protein
LAKKEAAAPPPPAAYQLPHHREHVYKSRQLGLIYLQYLKFSDYQVVSVKNTRPFRDLHTRVLTRSTFLGGGGTKNKAR